MNYVQVVGRIHALPKVTKALNTQYSKIEVTVKSNFRNSCGQFRDDVFDIYLWKGMKSDLLASSSIGSWVGIKGRLELDEGKIVIIAEHVEVFSKV